MKENVYERATRAAKAAEPRERVAGAQPAATYNIYSQRETLQHSRHEEEHSPTLSVYSEMSESEQERERERAEEDARSYRTLSERYGLSVRLCGRIVTAPPGEARGSAGKRRPPRHVNRSLTRQRTRTSSKGPVQSEKKAADDFAAEYGGSSGLSPHLLSKSALTNVYQKTFVQARAVPPQPPASSRHVSLAAAEAPGQMSCRPRLGELSFSDASHNLCFLSPAPAAAESVNPSQRYSHDILIPELDIITNERNEALFLPPRPARAAAAPPANPFKEPESDPAQHTRAPPLQPRQTAPPAFAPPSVPFAFGAMGGAPFAKFAESLSQSGNKSPSQFDSNSVSNASHSRVFQPVRRLDLPPAPRPVPLRVPAPTAPPKHIIEFRPKPLPLPLTSDAVSLVDSDRGQCSPAASPPEEGEVFEVLLEGVGRYIGQMAQGAMEGRGRILDARDRLVYDGWFRANEFEGIGTLLRAEEPEPGLPGGEAHLDLSLLAGRLQAYNGQFARSQFEGLGTLKYAGGAEFSGQFRAGRAEGMGLWTSGARKVQGTWSADRLVAAFN